MKKARFLCSMALAVGIIASSFSMVGAATPIADNATRYRLPLVKFELPVFKEGALIGTPTKFKVDPERVNGKLFNATVEKYDKLGATNKAFHIKCLHDMAQAEQYTGFKLVPHKDIGSNQTPLKDKTGIPANATDHGIMFYVNLSNFKYNDTTKTPAEVYDPYQRDIKIVFQDFDKNPDGSDALNEEGEKTVTPWAVTSGAPVTLVWMENVDFKATLEVLNDVGAPVKENGAVKYEDVQIKRQIGEAEVIKGYDGNTVKLPPKFVGYVVIPFSSFETHWDGEDKDGKINLSKIDMANFYTGFYPAMEGDIWFDDYCFWGPSFSDVTAAIDMGSSFKFTDAATNKGVPVGTQNPNDVSSDGGTNGGGTNGGGTSGGGTTGGGTTGGSANTGDNGVVWALWALFGAAMITGVTVTLKKKKA